MSSTQVLNVMDALRSEHRVIVLGLAVLENICCRYDKDGILEPTGPEQLARFFQEFVDPFHHLKEEEIIFRAIEQGDVRDENDLVGSLTADHTLGRAFLGAFEDAVAEMKAKPDDGEAARDLVDAARGYLTTQVHHICRENHNLCSFVEKAFDSDRLAQLAREYVESGRNKFPPGLQKEHEQAVERLRAEFGAAEYIMKLGADN
jgi:hemerythrin-like domain-containing protein